ncbi:MAG TPA: prepilin-type N-terminal cleavage/methylation domain-containing protein [Candidatus Microsaccharimonas sp.]
MHNKWAQRKGFTIIELLVSIVVIGILVTIMIVSYGGIQQRSRDSDRGSDITQLKIAIEKYHADKSMYPDVCGDNVGCNASSLATALSPYLATIPHDPRNTANSSTDYQYVRGLVTDDSYGLYVHYEAKSQCKTGANINPVWWSATVPSC